MSIISKLDKNAHPIEIKEVTNVISNSLDKAKKISLSNGVSIDEYYKIWDQRLSEFEFYSDIKETFKVPAYINGAIHAFEAFFLRHSDKRLRVLDGDFMYHEIIWRLPALGGAVKISEDNPIKNGDCFIVSLPFSKNGSVDMSISHLLEICTKLNVPVLLDMAYLPLVKNVSKLTNLDCVEELVFSLSKFSKGLERVRIGLRLQKKFIDDPVGAADFMGMRNNLGVLIGTEILKKFSLNYPYLKYKDKQHEVCEKLGLNPSDCVIFGLEGGDDFSSFQRAGVNRVCLSNILNG